MSDTLDALAAEGGLDEDSVLHAAQQALHGAIRVEADDDYEYRGELSTPSWWDKLWGANYKYKLTFNWAKLGGDSAVIRWVIAFHELQHMGLFETSPPCQNHHEQGGESWKLFNYDVFIRLRDVIRQVPALREQLGQDDWDNAFNQIGIGPPSGPASEGAYYVGR